MRATVRECTRTQKKGRGRKRAIKREKYCGREKDRQAEHQRGRKREHERESTRETNREEKNKTKCKSQSWRKRECEHKSKRDLKTERARARPRIRAKKEAHVAHTLLMSQALHLTEPHCVPSSQSATLCVGKCNNFWIETAGESARGRTRVQKSRRGRNCFYMYALSQRYYLTVKQNLRFCCLPLRMLLVVTVLPTCSSGTAACTRAAAIEAATTCYTSWRWVASGSAEIHRDSVNKSVRRWDCA